MRDTFRYLWSVWREPVCFVVALALVSFGFVGLFWLLGVWVNCGTLP